MRAFTLPVLLLCSAGSAPAFAQGAPAAAAPAAQPAEEAPVAEGEDIIVTGMGSGGYRLTADQLRDAVRAYQQHRAEFAPSAPLRWRVRPLSAAEGLEIRLVNRTGDRIAVPLTEDGHFTLPADTILAGGWRLQTNAGRRQIRIQPLTFSPGSDENAYRLGDARLLCRVYWAFANNRFGPLTRVAFGAIGGCSSQRVAIYWGSERPVASVDAGAGAVDVRADGSAYRLPLHDRTLSNEQRVRVTYR